MLLSIVVMSLCIFILTSTPGLYVGSKIVSNIIPGSLALEGVSGRIIDHFLIHKITYRHNGLAVELVNTEIEWHFNQLFKRALTIRNFSTDLVRVNEVKTPTPTTTASEFSLPKLPIVIHLERAKIKQLLFNTAPPISNINLSADLTTGQWQIKQLDLQLLEHLFYLKSTLTPVFPYLLNGTIVAESITTGSKPKQPVQGSITFSGDFYHYHAEGQFNQPLQANLRADLSQGSILDGELNWENFNWFTTSSTPLVCDQGNLKVTGTLPNLTATLNSHFTSPYESTLFVNAQVTPRVISIESIFKGAWGELNLTTGYNANKHPVLEGTLAGTLKSGFMPLLEALSIQGNFQGNGVDSLAAFAHLKGMYLNNNLDATLRYQPEHQLLQANLGANELKLTGKQRQDWQLNALFPQPNLLHPLLKDLKTTIKINGYLNDRSQGELDLALSKGQWQPPNNPIIAFLGGEIKGKLGTRGFTSTGNLALDENKKIELNLDLPQFNLKTYDPSTQPVAGYLKLTVNSLNFVSELISSIKNVQGQLDANLDIKGTLQHPVLDGLLTLSHGALDIPELNTHLQPIDFNLKSTSTNWVAEGQLYSKDKPLSIQGSGKFSSGLEGNIEIKGVDFQIMNTNEYQINISPTLAIDLLPTGVKVKGHILIPNALIKPQTFTESVSLTDDVVFVGKKTPTEETTFDTDLTIEMGNNVLLAVKGLKGFLEGKVQLLQEAGGPLNGSGELSIREGKYEAYGQNLTIDKGSLTFTGGLIENPGIQVRAVRQFNNTTSSFDGSNQLFDFDSSNLQSLDLSGKTSVGIEVTGRLASPKVQLYSSPASLSQADILSLLLLGKPASQANKSGAQLLYTAISALNLNSGTKGTQLLSQLKQKLGIDFGIENNAEYNKKTNQISDNTAFVIGKSLSPRLYLSYNLGISQNDSNALTLKYLLNKFFSIQVNASINSSGIDVLYTRQVDRIFKKKKQ